MLTFDALVVSSRYSKWLTDQLQSGHGFPVIQDHALYAPVTSLSVAWWTPQEHYLRLLYSGVPMPPVISPSDSWLSSYVAHHNLQRHIETMSVIDFLDGTCPGSPFTDGVFIKPANFKCPQLEAQWVDSHSTAKMIVETADLPLDSKIQVSDRWLEIETEYRCFMLDGLCVGVSIYAGDPSQGRSVDALARDYSEMILRKAGKYPRAFVLDVAITRSNGWVVIEANPAWSSNPYDCGGPNIVDTILAANGSHALDGEVDEFAWKPDPYIVREVLKKTALPRSKPPWDVS